MRQIGSTLTSRVGGRRCPLQLMSDPPLSPGAARRPCLVVVAGFGIGRVYPLKPHTTIGRAPENDLVFPYPTVSWSHAVVGWTDGKVTVRDLGSRNGTLVGVDKVKFRELVEGDVVAIGDTIVLKLVNLRDEELARAAFEPGDRRDRTTDMANTAALLDRLRVEQQFTHDDDLPVILTFFRVDGLAALDRDSMVESAMRRAARTIQAAMRCEVVLARSAYDEFIALGRTIVSLAREMANEARLKSGRIGGGPPWRRVSACTLSVAVVPVLPQPELSSDEILRAAQTRAQAALSTVTNDVVVLDPVGTADDGPA
jgi:pSer/pThr/pTyr-binding forkhead associated (FHA) protein